MSNLSQNQAKKGQAIQNNISELRKKIERKEGEKHALRKKIKLCEEILAEPRENHEEEIRAKKTEKVGFLGRPYRLFTNIRSIFSSMTFPCRERIY